MRGSDGGVDERAAEDAVEADDEAFLDEEGRELGVGASGFDEGGVVGDGVDFLDDDAVEGVDDEDVARGSCGR